MPSPFPGMDPWLERSPVFPDVHNSLIYTLKAAILAALPETYFIAGENRVYVDPELRRVPDIGVFGPNGTAEHGPDAAVATITRAGLLAAATEPVVDPVEEQYLEIRSMEDERLVTAIEIVSLANKKAGDNGRTSYQQKQGEYRLSGVNLVEIDLLRAGRHTTAVPEARLRAVGGEFDYHVSLMLARNPREYFVAPFHLADRLPMIPVPLDPEVAPVMVDFQAVFDRCYDESGFARRAKYDRKPCDPPLTPDQQAWAEAILREKGLLK